MAPGARALERSGVLQNIERCAVAGGLGVSLFFLREWQWEKYHVGFGVEDWFGGADTSEGVTWRF